MDKSDKERGLYGKYYLEKTDGTPLDPEAKYIILRYDGDRFNEQQALMQYAESIKDDYPAFAAELYDDVYEELVNASEI